MFCRTITNAIGIFAELFIMKQRFLFYFKCGRKVYYSNKWYLTYFVNQVAVFELLFFPKLDFN